MYATHICCIFVILSHEKSVRSFVYVNIYSVGHFIVHFSEIRPARFSLQNGKDAVYERRNGRRRVYLPPKLAFVLYG